MLLKERSSLLVSAKRILITLAEPKKKFKDINDFKPVDFVKIRKQFLDNMEKQKKDSSASDLSHLESAQARSEHIMSDKLKSSALQTAPKDIQLVLDRFSKSIEEPNPNIKEWLVDLIKKYLQDANALELYHIRKLIFSTEIEPKFDDLVLRFLNQEKDDQDEQFMNSDPMMLLTIALNKLSQGEKCTNRIHLSSFVNQLLYFR